MYTPHPSLVPVEMASAGMLTVTNSCGIKTADRLTSVAGNLIVVEPTVEGVESGLRLAAERVQDYDERARAAAAVKWSTNWQEAFNQEFMATINAFLARSAGKDEGLSRAA